MEVPRAAQIPFHQGINSLHDISVSRVLYKVEPHIKTSEKLSAGQDKSFIHEDEHGVLLGFLFSANDDDVTPVITIYGDNGSPMEIIGESPKELARLGLGIGPGDFKEPDSTSPDPSSHSNGVFPWVTRWKQNSDTDDTGSTQIRFGIAYTPFIPPHYRRITVHVKNPTTSSKEIKYFKVVRMVFEELEPVEQTAPDKKFRMRG